MNNLYSPYKEMPGMGQSLSPLAATPLGNGLGGLHNAQQSLPNYGPPGPDKMLSPNFDAHHTAMLTRGDQHLSRGLGTPPAAMMSHLNGLHHPGHAQSHGPVLAPSRERPPSSSSGSQVATSGQLEEINTKEVAQRITAELKRYSIPQAIFAQRVLCRSQGTLSDLLRNPKPWSKLKSGRETFRRMWKWLQEPEFQRMSALRLAGKPRGSSGVGLPAALAPGAGTEPPLRVPCPSSSRLAICSLLQTFSFYSFSPLFSVLPCSFSPFSPPCLPSFLSDPRPGFVRTLLTVPTTLPSLSDLLQLWKARGGCAVSTRSPVFPRLPGTAGLPLFRTLCT